MLPCASCGDSVAAAAVGKALRLYPNCCFNGLLLRFTETNGKRCNKGAGAPSVAELWAIVPSTTSLRPGEWLVVILVGLKCGPLCVY